MADSGAILDLLAGLSISCPIGVRLISEPRDLGQASARGPRSGDLKVKRCPEIATRLQGLKRPTSISMAKTKKSQMVVSAEATPERLKSKSGFQPGHPKWGGRQPGTHGAGLDRPRARAGLQQAASRSVFW
jgi:hypothetical protein